MSYKFSLFNIIDEMEDGTYSFYNTKSRHHLILNLKQDIQGKNINLENCDFIQFLPEKTKIALIKKGFIIDASVDEIEDLKKQSNEDRFGDGFGLILALLPTLNCNFRCPYCFEDFSNIHANQKMTQETQNNIVDFAKNKLAAGIKGPLYVKWFGGEPLLAKETMLELSKKLQEVAAVTGNKYISSMVTNGYLLNELSSSDLEKLDLFAVQVTIDGPEKIHNQRRPHKEGKNSFNQIIKNLEGISKFIKRIYIRINVDKSNAKDIPELLSYLENHGLLEKCQYNLGYIDTQTGRYSIDPLCHSVITKEDVLYIDSVVMQGLSKLGIEEIEHSEYPKFITFACDAQLKNSYVINPDGYIFKCLNDATILERSLFNINTKQNINPDREHLFLYCNPYAVSECKKCSFLPVCQGGCPAKYIDIKEHRPFCWPFTYVLKEKILKQAKNNLKKEALNG